MEDERITLRMGTEEVQTMDRFLDGRPELGSRSQFIRTAVREYINRDAGVSAPSDRNGIFLKLTPSQMNSLARLRADGKSIDDAEYIRSVLNDRFSTVEKREQEAREAYESTTNEAFDA